ncbi:preprotein translocase subunit SecE [Thioalkalivibrio paradoxus]|uniref:Protein translocase subunit SecE n=1 Tax=Thioalkalivibrio paradoxus ARh 1 TaxID=713585 RepID=W0DQK2_9GAMM|nr:preprotein translocase subunit SecE [Thioalkalivibrio paradoxus]AHE99258.1 preprotein translocase subunit SecE [Thioalkalivibrio paradoxus ARh 1]
MSERMEQTGGGLDTVKLSAAVALLIAGVMGFYYFAAESMLVRVLGLLGVVAVAVFIAMTTAKGRQLAGFLGNARTEVRKMVWPTRVETTQTTLIVLGVVILVGIFLWLLDSLLGWIIRQFIG